MLTVFQKILSTDVFVVTEESSPFSALVKVETEQVARQLYMYLDSGFPDSSEPTSKSIHSAHSPRLLFVKVATENPPRSELTVRIVLRTPFYPRSITKQIF